MDIYSLSRSFWDFSFENPEKMKPIHSSIFFFAIEHCNRLWWKDKFWFPTTMVMDAIWISNYSSYKKWLEELVEWGFIKMIQVSKNQYSANVISLIQFVWSTDKALDKALIKHGTKQHIKQDESIASIDIQVYNSTNLQNTNIQTDTVVSQPNEYQLSISYLKDNRNKVFTQELEIPDYAENYRDEWHKFVWYWSELSKTWKLKAEWEKTFEIKRRFATWMSRKKETYQKTEKPSVMDIVL